jgi:hypothetical protein
MTLAHSEVSKGVLQRSSPNFAVIFVFLAFSTTIYSSILRGIASRFQNFTARAEVALRKRVAISIRSQLHA